MRNFYNRKVAEGGEIGRALEETVQAVELTKVSTEEDDRAQIHVQPAYDPQVYSSDIPLGLSPSVHISKNQTYVRPQHPKVFCDKCNIKPEGFRGPHELRRHIENKHADHRTVWVCVDRSPDKKFLSECKQCNEGKQYGAYYNAAAHLRRIHFHQKKYQPRGKGWGGDGGYDDPPMEILKLWIQAVSVPNGPQTQAESDKSSDEDAFELLGTVGSGGETGTSLRDHEYGPAGKKSPEAPHLEIPNRSDPFVQEARLSIDIKPQVRNPQEPVNVRRQKRRYTPAERQEVMFKRKSGSCQDCRKAKRKVSVLLSWQSSAVTNASLVYAYACPAKESGLNGLYGTNGQTLEMT